MLKGTQGVFARVYELRNNPLILKGLSGIGDIEEGRYHNSYEKSNPYYMGIEQDMENRRKDRENMARDFNKAFQAAKVKLGV